MTRRRRHDVDASAVAASLAKGETFGRFSAGKHTAEQAAALNREPMAVLVAADREFPLRGVVGWESRIFHCYRLRHRKTPLKTSS
jgi:hypothetical protein